MIKKKLHWSISMWDMVLSSPFSFLCIPVFINTLIHHLMFMEWGVGIVNDGFFCFGFSLLFFSSTFMVFCVGIGSMVLWFSVYYMPKQDLNTFSFLIYHFILFMIYLTVGLNTLSMFLGWEGVGVISFLLIGWFSKREMALSGAKQAVLFNRLTDGFFLVLILWEIGNGISFFEPMSGVEGMSPPLMLLGAFLLSSAGKSAQFIFHPWLTSAMEGPTPVSSLLHSSTMVVAGVFLLMLLQPHLISTQTGGFVLGIIASTSLLTLLGVSIWALTQQDLKKIIALSTTSQLSFMMILICFNFVDLAFLHMILHGFFKALIFMGSGVMIHSLPSGSQDIKKVTSPSLHLLFIVSFIVGNLGLMGAPFIGAFFSKHLLLAQLVSNGTGFSGFHWGLFVVSMFLTAGYSLKTLHIALANSKKLSLFTFHFSYWEILPLFILSSVTLLLGPLILPTLGGGELEFISFDSEFRNVWTWSIVCGGGLLFLYSSGKTPKDYSFLSFYSTSIIMSGTSLLKSSLGVELNKNLENFLLKFILKKSILSIQSQEWGVSSPYHLMLPWKSTNFLWGSLSSLFIVVNIGWVFL